MKKIQDTPGPSFPDHSSRPTIDLWLWPSWGDLVQWEWSDSTATRCSFCSGNRSCRAHFAPTCFMSRPCTKISDIVVFGAPRSASSSHTARVRSLLTAACTRSTFSGVLLVAGLPGRGSLSADSRPYLKHLCHTLIFAAHLALSPKAF